VPTLVHCGYHKCLTVYTDRCFRHVLGDRFRSFFGKLDLFYAEHRSLAVSGTSDYCLDLSKLDDYRISRFIRDPRDLVVSGYFYHHRGLDPFAAIVGPTAEQWRDEGAIPQALRAGESYVECLKRLDQEDGLIAEMEFREPHFRAMLEWPTNDPRIRLWRYEDVLGNEVRVMDEIGAHFEWPDDDSPLSFRESLRREADRWRMRDALLAWDKHPRDPKSGQWRQLFTPKVRRRFDELYEDLPERLGYESW
jgi:hypothetical protein